MDLRNNNITVGELLDNPKSRAVFQRRFGRYLKHPMVGAARSLSLAQLAAMADTHFRVEKGEDKGMTFTHVAVLEREDRKQELARLIGGTKVTQALLESAEELLNQAEGFKGGLKGDVS